MCVCVCVSLHISTPTQTGICVVLPRAKVFRKRLYFRLIFAHHFVPTLPVLGVYTFEFAINRGSLNPLELSLEVIPGPCTSLEITDRTVGDMGNGGGGVFLHAGESMPLIRISMHDTSRHGLSIPFEGAAKVLKAIARDDDDDDEDGDDDTLATVNDDVWARLLETKVSVCSTMEGGELDNEIISDEFYTLASKSYARHSSDWGSIDVQLKMTDDFDSSALPGGSSILGRKVRLQIRLKNQNCVEQSIFWDATSGPPHTLSVQRQSAGSVSSSSSSSSSSLSSLSSSGIFVDGTNMDVEMGETMVSVV